MSKHISDAHDSPFHAHKPPYAQLSSNRPQGLIALQYHNIFALVRELGIEWPFTDWKTSGFWSPEGLTIEAPVFNALPRLPTMLGQFVHTLPLFRHKPCRGHWHHHGYASKVWACMHMLPWTICILGRQAAHTACPSPTSLTFVCGSEGCSILHVHPCSTRGTPTASLWALHTSLLMRSP